MKKKLTRKIIEKLNKYAQLDIDEDYYDEDEDENLSEKEKEELDKKVEEAKEETKKTYSKFWKEFENLLNWELLKMSQIEINYLKSQNLILLMMKEKSFIHLQIMQKE